MIDAPLAVPRIACLFGEPLEPFVGPVARHPGELVATMGGEMVTISAEAAWAAPDARPEVDGVYVLPFDPPRSAPDEREDVVAELFPGAPVLVPFALQDLCWDKVATQERLLKHGVATPATLVTDDLAEVRSFVRDHRMAILKEPRGCGGSGHLVLWIEDGALVGDGGSHQVRIEARSDGPTQLDGEVLRYAPPFYVQRLIVQHGRGLPVAGQVLRAYVVDGEIRFWTERRRDHYRRPSDFIVNAGRGARYRFLHYVRHETAKLALRAAEATGVRWGVLDLVRTQGAGPYVLEVDVDGAHMIVDRSYSRIPEFRDYFDFDRYLAQAIVRRLQGDPTAEPSPMVPAPKRF